MPTNTLLGSQLENIPYLQDAIVDMNEDELKELTDQLKNNITHYMKRVCRIFEITTEFRLYRVFKVEPGDSQLHHDVNIGIKLFRRGDN